MTPVDAALLRRKLSIIVQNLDALAVLGNISTEEYAADRIRRKADELLQEAIEAAVDINLHILRALDARSRRITSGASFRSALRV